MTGWKRIFTIIKNHIGYILTTLCVLGCLLATIIVTANQTSSDSLAWTINFCQSIAQDLFITPAIYLAVQYLYLRMSEQNFSTYKRIRNMLLRQIDPVLWSLKVKLIIFKVFSYIF